MKLCYRLYGTVWVAFFSCVLIPRWLGPHAGGTAHGLLGLLLLILTLANAKSLGALPVPARLKRISKVTAGFALVQVVAGIVLSVAAHRAVALPVPAAPFYVAHIVCALAILAQTASVATAYDMWEEREFETVGTR